MIHKAFNDQNYIKERYGTANRVFLFMQSFAVFALFLFFAVFVCGLYWVNQFEKALELNDVAEGEVTRIDINQGFNDTESFVYFTAILGEVEILSKQNKYRLYMPSGIIGDMGIKVGKTIPILKLPGKTSVFPVGYDKSIPELYKLEVLFFLFVIIVIGSSFILFRWIRVGMTRYISTSNIQEIIGVCTALSPMDRTVTFRYEITDKKRFSRDIVTRQEYKQISVGDKLHLIVPRENIKRAYIRPIEPLV